MNNCDKCGKPAVYHSTLIVNGVSQTTNLCRDCAVKEGVFNTEPASIFDDFFAPFADFLPFEKVENLVCPVCKTSLRDFKASLHVGCPNCYETFRNDLNAMIKRISRFENHKPESISNTTKTVKDADNKPTKQSKIDELRAEMKQAVAEERYEDAGKLKKKIQKLEAEND